MGLFNFGKKTKNDPRTADIKLVQDCLAVVSAIFGSLKMSENVQKSEEERQTAAAFLLVARMVLPLISSCNPHRYTR